MEIVARFVSGLSPLGHHWDLLDGEERPLGRSRYAYDGAGKVGRRLQRAIGFGTTAEMRASVLDAEGAERLRVRSTARPSRVELTDAIGTPLGAVRRDELALELLSPAGDGVVGRVDRDNKDDVAWPVLDARGAQVAVLARTRPEIKGPSLSDWVFAVDMASNHTALQATMHFGFAGSPEYRVIADELPAAQPLRTLVAELPILAAYAY
jgi:hypothetical protein